MEQLPLANGLIVPEEPLRASKGKNAVLVKKRQANSILSRVANTQANWMR